MTNAHNGAGRRADALADRLERGARALVALADGLSDAEWKTSTPGDGRTIGDIVHHVASVYPLEIELAQVLASGKPIEGVTMGAIHEMNAQHTREFGAVGREETGNLLRVNSKAAADAVRALTDEELDEAAEVSLYANAVLTTQFFIEDHALRHSLHHLARLRKALNS